MTTDLILSVTATSLVWVLICVTIYLRTRKQFESKLSDANEQIRNSYDKGFEKGIDNRDISVQVFPWREEIEVDNFFKNRKSVKFGYKYQLFVKGIPCLEPHTNVLEEISTDKINSENILRLAQNIDSILSNLPASPTSGLKVVGTAKDLALGLLTEKAKKN